MSPRLASSRYTRRWARAASSLVLLAVCLALPRRARADDSNYQNFIIGGRAIGLGGAYTSLADDASGLYYNPAGIADVRQSSVQLSSSLYGFERQSYQPGALTLPVPGVEKLKPEFTELIIVPASAGYVRSFGAKGPDGLPVQSYGVSVLVPSFRSSSFTSPRSSPADTQTSSILTELPPHYRRRVSDRSLWTGIGYGRKFGSRLRLGVSGYYVLRSFADSEELALSADVQGSQNQVFRTASNDVSFINGSILLILGAKYRFSKRLTLGAAVRSPSLGVNSQDTLRFVSGESIPDCGSSPSCATEPLFQNGPRSRFDTVTIDDARSQTTYPTMVRLGASWVEPYRYTVSVDVSYDAPVRYRLVSVDAATAARLPFNPEVIRRAVVNVNLGAEYLLVRQVSIAAGFFTDYSSAPKIPADPVHDYLPRTNLYGVSLALGYFGKHSLSRLGVMYSFGHGRDVIPVSDISRLLDDVQRFRRVDAFESFFYFFVSSTFRY